MVTIRTRDCRDKKGGRKVIYLDIYISGQRKTEYLKLFLTGNRKEDAVAMVAAEEIKRIREQEILAAGNSLDAFTVDEKDFINYLEAMFRKRPKYDKLNTAIKHLRAFSGGSLSFSQLDEEWFERFDEYMLTKMKGSSANNIIVVIKMALNQAAEEGIIKKNPLKKVKKHRTYSKRIYLTFEEVQKLSETECRYPVVKDAFLFSCYTGLRISDIEEIRWKDIQDGQVALFQQKTDELVYIPLAKSAEYILCRQTKGGPDDPIFAMPSRNSIFTGLKGWIAAAGITKNVTFHTSRHTFATLSLKYGKQLYTVSKLLGHTDISTTQIYAKIMDEEKQRTIDSLPELKM